MDELHATPGNFINRQLPLVNEAFLKGAATIKEPVYIFEINPIKEGTTSVHEALITYLATKDLSVDVWDGDSLMHFGQARVRLASLLRQGKDTEVFTPTLEVIHPGTGEIRASLQLNLRNQG